MKEDQTTGNRYSSRKIILWILFAVPFFVSFIGYRLEGLSLLEAVYSAATLYFIESASDAMNGLIMFGKITALIASAGLIASIVKNIFTLVSHGFSKFFSTSSVVHSDLKWGAMLAATIRHGYLCDHDDTRWISKTRYHYLMYDNDLKNLQFIEKYHTELNGKSVFILLQNINSMLLKSTSGSRIDIHYFNVYELMAREYWKQYDLFALRAAAAVRIAIIGFEDAGRALFRYGYMNNLYRTEQHFTYHIYGAGEADKTWLKDLDFINGDCVVTHDNDVQQELREIAGMDRIILADMSSPSTMLLTLQALLYENPLAPVHYFSDSDVSAGSFLNAENVVSFGNMKELLTEDNIRNESLFRMAKLFHYDYVLPAEDESATINERAMEQAWKELDGFKKGSNIARADHYRVEQMLLKSDPDMTQENLQELEHQRWCRYHFINHWSYGKERDNHLRRHPLLVPYEKLSDREKPKSGIKHQVVKEAIESLL